MQDMRIFLNIPHFTSTILITVLSYKTQETLLILLLIFFIPFESQHYGAFVKCMEDRQVQTDMI